MHSGTGQADLKEEHEGFGKPAWKVRSVSGMNEQRSTQKACYKLQWV